MIVFKKFNISALIASLFISGAAIAADDQIIVFDWGGYEDPAFFTAYVDKYGASPEYSFFSDEEEAF
jgi:spermidine/putrescine-binding protein